MKIWIASDLHSEICAPDFAAVVPEADVLVLAGDCANLTSAHEFLQSLQRHIDMDIIFVAGNHEFYGRSISAGLETLASAMPDHVHFLENTAITLGGVRFLGATLWTNFCLCGADMCSDAIQTAEAYMLDFRRITSPRGNLAEEMIARHTQSRAFIAHEMQVGFDGPTVVVTHHAPHPDGVNPKYRRSLIDAAFAADCTPLLMKGTPDLWISGHTHCSHDFVAGGTRFIANCHGYRSRNSHGYERVENEAWQPAYVLELLPDCH